MAGYTWEQIAEQDGTTTSRMQDADALTPWLAEAAGSELGSFAAGLRQDEQAMRAALMLPWSSGQVEGQIARLKLVKRQATDAPSSTC